VKILDWTEEDALEAPRRQQKAPCPAAPGDFMNGAANKRLGQTVFEGCGYAPQTREPKRFPARTPRHCPVPSNSGCGQQDARFRHRASLAGARNGGFTPRRWYPAVPASMPCGERWMWTPCGGFNLQWAWASVLSQRNTHRICSRGPTASNRQSESAAGRKRPSRLRRRRAQNPAERRAGSEAL
jgi:hypothetical protein